jgi:hypothetical protein
VATHAAVGVDDDLAAGEAGIAHGAADDEAAGGVDEHLVVVVGELLGDDRADDLLDEIGRIIESRSMPGVLGGDEHGAQADRLAVLVVEGDLGLAVGPQVRDGAALRTSARRSAMRWASQIGSGISTSVSSHA